MKNYEYQKRENLKALLEDQEFRERRILLEKIAETFQNNKVKWALAWSTNLFFRGIVDNFHDLDIIYDPIPMQAMVSILDGIGIKVVSMDNADCFSTKVFMKCLSDTGIQVEIMSDFGLKLGEVDYSLKVDDTEIEKVALNDKQIPLFVPEIEYLLYAILEDKWQPMRRHKRILVEEFILQDGVQNVTVFGRALREKLPEWIQNRLQMMREPRF